MIKYFLMIGNLGGGAVICVASIFASQAVTE